MHEIFTRLWHGVLEMSLKGATSISKEDMFLNDWNENYVNFLKSKFSLMSNLIFQLYIKG